MPGYKRKKLNLEVKKEFQRWLLARIFAVVLLSSLLAALIIFLFIRLEPGAQADAPLMAAQARGLLWLALGAGGLISLLAGMLLAVFLPQKVAGPIFRMERELEAVRRGDLTAQIRLRTDDPLHDLAGCINRTVDVLRVRVHEMQEICEDLEQAEQCGILRERIKRVCAGLQTYRT
jgi:methyl-accepting chemotaxis protein